MRPLGGSEWCPSSDTLGKSQFLHNKPCRDDGHYTYKRALARYNLAKCRLLPTAARCAESINRRLTAFKSSPTRSAVFTIPNSRSTLTSSFSRALLFRAGSSTNHAMPSDGGSACVRPGPRAVEHVVSTFCVPPDSPYTLRTLPYCLLESEVNFSQVSTDPHATAISRAAPSFPKVQKRLVSYGHQRRALNLRRQSIEKYKSSRTRGWPKLLSFPRTTRTFGTQRLTRPTFSNRGSIADCSISPFRSFI